ncbi:DpnII family type II restriction endonuclease [Lactiplantibacillus plantarum]|uniref:DpnII family type II restriction endonuclease n=1 Tax=Lactiplantibacillus plantarum TaxID=1590 RepID=UPI0007BC0F53|nr:DpnII family type II restriction endonuclease [Lactiplantibacillus plantarum]KZU04306.1 Type II restriction enzyme MjaIII [Lactiplantibacillus plantarum]
MLQLPANVFDYLDLSSEERTQLFLATNTLSNKPADYYIDFVTTTGHIAVISDKLQELSESFKPNTMDDIDTYFSTHPELLTLIPTLLAIRVSKTMDVQGSDINPDDYSLDFLHPEKTLTQHLRFIHESGLADFLLNHPVTNFIDLAQGIEIGLNSNARKNRGGFLGEAFLEKSLSKFATQVKPDKTTSKTIYTPVTDDYSFVDQGTMKVMQTGFGIDLTGSGIPTNRRFDGAVYHRPTHNLALLEIGGSKLKSVAGEFTDLNNILTNAGYTFIYVTSGNGWTNDTSHIRTAIAKIPYLFNYEMVKHGYIQQLLQSQSNN